MLVDKNLLIEKQHLYDSDVYMAVYTDTILKVFATSALVVPLLCFLPCLVFFQFFGDAFLAVCFLLFVIVPLLVGLKATVKTITSYYMFWLLAYFLPLFVRKTKKKGKKNKERKQGEDEERE